MLSFISKMIQMFPPEQLVERMNLTAFDELIDIDLSSGIFVSRYHADGKFFIPVSTNNYEHLYEYVSSHMVHPDDAEAQREIMSLESIRARLGQGEPKGILSGEIRYMGVDGNWHRMHHLMICGTEYRLEPNHVYFYLHDVQDLLDRERGQHTDAAASTERMRELLPDMLPEASFFTICSEKAARRKEPWCMIAVDVKHYKLFRELNGREKGEILLVRFGEILHGFAEELGGAACYRGQDDFGLFIPFEQTRIDQLFAELRTEIQSLSNISGFFPILGICMVDDDCTDAMELFNKAALTAEEIKDDLRYHIRVYDPKLHERHVEEFKLLTGFNEAKTHHRIRFYMQPQVDIQTGKIVGAESLARWQREDGTFVSPAVFVPALEKYGVVTDLDVMIWEQVCQWIRSLLDRGFELIPISVNISRMNIYSVDVPQVLTGLIQKYDLTPSMLEVEITESAYVEDSERIKWTISELQKRGFRVLMDDFGSGYSSLNMLRSIHVDVIKLDAQFLRFSVGEEQKGINILESVINMTKSLSTPIIVEGVESRELIHFLRDMGCRYMQGFYYYHPMPPQQFEELLKDPEKTDHRGIVMIRNQEMHTREFLDENLYSDAMLNNILGPVAFYSVQDSNVDIVRYNQQFVELVGLEPDVLEERRNHIQQFFYPEDLDKFYSTLQAAAADRINGAAGLFRIFKPNRTLLWMQLHVYFLREDNGQKIYYGSARDMTELQFINQDLPGGYYRATLRDGFELLYISQTMLDMLGYTREEIKNRFHNRLLYMIHPEDRKTVETESDEIRVGNIKKLSPYRILHRDGRYRYVMDQSRVTDLYGDLCWQAVLVDITEVMTLRNRMHLLEKFSTDCILFIHDIKHPERAEAACYGLEQYLKISGAEFLRQMNQRELHILNRNGENLIDLLREGGADQPGINGVYRICPQGGGEKNVHVRIYHVAEGEQDVDCIISLTPVSGSEPAK